MWQKVIQQSAYLKLLHSSEGQSSSYFVGEYMHCKLLVEMHKFYAKLSLNDFVELGNTFVALQVCLL